MAETNDRFHLNYLVVGNKVVCTPGEQYFLADVGDGTEAIESATLTYKNATTEVETEIPADTIEAGTLLFEMNMDESQPDGEYEVTKIAVASGGQTYLIDMADTGIEARFGVNAEVDTNADAYVEEEETADAQTDSELQEAGITVMDAQGQEITYDNLSEALQEANEDVADNGIAAQSEINPNLVVVLDPGHGGSDSGACGYGLREKDLTLKIANYCKAKLQEYSHVEVYMTRTGDTDNNLADRVNFANQYNPDIFVSIHINAVSRSLLHWDLRIGESRSGIPRMEARTRMDLLPIIWVSSSVQRNMDSRQCSSSMHLLTIQEMLRSSWRVRTRCVTWDMQMLRRLHSIMDCQRMVPTVPRIR